MKQHAAIYIFYLMIFMGASAERVCSDVSLFKFYKRKLESTSRLKIVYISVFFFLLLSLLSICLICVAICLRKKLEKVHFLDTLYNSSR